jgi:hypothetical protein
VLFTVVPAVWGAFEFATGSPFWGTIFLGLAAYAGYGFFFDFNPDRDRGDPPGPKEPPRE